MENIEKANYNRIPRSAEVDSRYSNLNNNPRGIWLSTDISVGPAVAENVYTITVPSGRHVEPPVGRSWRLAMSGKMLMVIWFPESIKLYNDKSRSYVYAKKPIAPTIAMPSIDFTFIRGIQSPPEWEWGIEQDIEMCQFKFERADIIRGTEMLLEVPKHLYIDTTSSGIFSINWVIADSESPKKFAGDLCIEIV
jgi:hypothetical protein